MHILTLRMINWDYIKTLAVWSLISSTAVNKDSYFKFVTIIFIMKNQGESHPLLAQILSAPNGATSSGIKNETLRNKKQSTATYGHPALDPP